MEGKLTWRHGCACVTLFAQVRVSGRGFAFGLADWAKFHGVFFVSAAVVLSQICSKLILF
jgi:hypothetical protein